jgi:hypothetical protein
MCNRGVRRLALRRRTRSLSRRQHLGSLDKVNRIVQLGVSVATVGDVREHPKVADGCCRTSWDETGTQAA